MIVQLFVAHFIGDFAFQNEWMVVNKGKSWKVLAYHCLTYTAAIAWICGIYNPYCLAFLAIIHFIIDAMKARYKIITEIYYDQMAHFIVLLIIGLSK